MEEEPMVEDTSKTIITGTKRKDMDNNNNDSEHNNTYNKRHKSKKQKTEISRDNEIILNIDNNVDNSNVNSSNSSSSSNASPVRITTTPYSSPIANESRSGKLVLPSTLIPRQLRRGIKNLSTEDSTTYDIHKH